MPADIARILRLEGGEVPFCRFMEIALGHPEVGYYRKAEELVGRRGDFTTAPVRSQLFSHSLARILQQLLDGIFTVSPGAAPLVVELGAGTGDLAAGILDYWRRNRIDLRDRIAFRTVDVSEELRRRQAQRMAAFAGEEWDVSAMESLGSWPGPGVLYANELLDALPVRRVRVTGEIPEEAWVVLGDGDAVEEEWRPVTPEAQAELSRLFGTDDPLELTRLSADGHFELRPVVGELLGAVAEAFSGPSCLVWIDYGDWLLGPEGVGGGLADLPRGTFSRVLHGRTLRGYFKHQRQTDLYRLAGRQDLTADVDFRALDVHGGRHGFERLMLTSLASFLRSAGASRDLEVLSEEPYSLDTDSEETVFEALLEENDVGGLFKVMVQVREG